MADMDSTIEEHNSETVPQNESFAAKHRNRDDAEHREDVQFALLLAKEMDELPPGYFTSVPFVGTMVSMSLTVVSAYFGFAVPASVLTFINMDIGTYKQEAATSISGITSPQVLKGATRPLGHSEPDLQADKVGEPMQDQARMPASSLLCGLYVTPSVF